MEASQLSDEILAGWGSSLDVTLVLEPLYTWKAAACCTLSTSDTWWPALLSGVAFVTAVSH